MKQLKTIKKMIARREQVDANWINFFSAAEVEACRKALMDAGYVLDTSDLTPEYAAQFSNPKICLPQETWTPGKEG